MRRLRFIVSVAAATLIVAAAIPFLPYLPSCIVPYVAEAYSGFGGVWATRTGDFVSKNFAGTRGGIQAANDYLIPTGSIQLTAVAYPCSSTVYIKSGVALRGALRGGTIIRRLLMADGDANNTGAVLGTGPSAGTFYTPGSPGSKIEISNLTVDGNAVLFSGITNANLVPSGIRGEYVDGLTILNVGAYNTLGTGYAIRGCRNVTMSQILAQNVGQSSITNLGKNGISLAGDALAGWGSGYVLSDLHLRNVGDEAIFAGGINGLSIANAEADTCDFAFEVSNVSLSTGYTCGDWTISNFTARNILDYFVTFNESEAIDYTNIAFSNLVMSGNPTLHDGGVIGFPATAGVDVDRVSFTNCVFSNINTKDTSFHHWVDSQPGAVGGRTGIALSNCQFYGKPGSTRTGQDVALNFRGSHSNIRVSHVLLKDVPGTGLRINDTNIVSNTVARDMVFDDVMVDGANDYAFRTTCATASSAATMTEIHFNDCTAKDSNKQTTGAAFQLFVNQAGTTTSKIFLNGCRAYKTSGTSLTYGLDMNQSAGTLDEITIVGCDFSGTQTNWLVKNGTVTNVHFSPRPGRGSDIASAASIVIPQNGTIFHVTGANNITNQIQVDPWDNGRTATLIFDSTPTVTDTGTSKLNGNFVATADDALTVESDGTSWFELARSPN